MLDENVALLESFSKSRRAKFMRNLSCDVKIVLSNKSSVIEGSSEFDYRSFGNRTFDCVRLAKLYCEFDYVRLSSAIERLVFDWVRLPNCSIV